MPNRFYSGTDGGYGEQLMGLSKIIGDSRARNLKRKADQAELDEKTRISNAKSAIAAAVQSGDTAKVRQLLVTVPELADGVTKALKVKLPGASSEIYTETLRTISLDPTQAQQALDNMIEQFKKDGVIDEKEQKSIDDLRAKISTGDIKQIQNGAEVALSLVSDKDEWADYKSKKDVIVGKQTAAMKNIEFFDNLRKTNPDLADKFAIGVGLNEKDKSTAAMKNFNKYIELLNTDPEQAKLFGDQVGIGRVTPKTDIAKLKYDLDNGMISDADYEKQRDKILNPGFKSTIELTQAALQGDAEAKNIIEQMAKDAVELSGNKSKAATQGKLKALYDSMDLDAVAQAVLEGREIIDNVKNTFGVPIQEVVRAKVLAVEPDFNFAQPRAIQKSLNASLLQQQKNRGAMGSFVQNINGQVDKVEEIMTKVVSRFGVRALDIPWRNLKVLAVGSGDERVLEAYTKEISVEIFKLSQGSTASVALLPEAGRKEWEAIHDVNLSWPETKKVMMGTRDMANIRLKSVNDEIKRTVDQLGNIREINNKYEGGPDGQGPGAEFPGSNPNIVTVVNPQTKETEVWDIKTEKRIK